MNFIKSGIVEFETEIVVEKSDNIEKENTEIIGEKKTNIVQIIEKQTEPTFKDRWNVEKDIRKIAETENLENKKIKAIRQNYRKNEDNNPENILDNFEEKFINQKEKEKDKEIKKEDIENDFRSFQKDLNTGDENLGTNLNCHKDLKIIRNFIENQDISKNPFAKFNKNRINSEVEVENSKERKVFPEIKGDFCSIEVNQNILSENYDINRLIEMNMNAYQELNALENSVSNAGNQLCTMAHKLHQVERCLDCCSLEDIDDLSMLELLESMHEVRSEYQNLRKDIQEVQQLQRDVSTTLRFQMHNMHQTYQLLKKRLELKAIQK